MHVFILNTYAKTKKIKLKRILSPLSINNSQISCLMTIINSLTITPRNFL